MKKILLTLAITAAIAGQASAVLNFDLTPPGDAGRITTSGGNLFGTITGAQAKVNFTGTTGNVVFAPSVGLTAYLLASTNATPGDFNGLLGTFTSTTPTVVTYGSISFGDGVTLNDSENFQLNPVPEPSAFAALGLGAVALVRRRRKA